MRVACSNSKRSWSIIDKKNSFKNIRQVLADSKVTDFSDLFRLLFDTVDDWGKGHVAECILVLSQYQQSDAVVVDKEINIMAMFIEVLGVIKWMTKDNIKNH